MTNKNTQKAKSIEDFIKNKLSAAQFERLHELLGMTKYALTSMLRRPHTQASIDHIKDLAKLLGCEPKYLVDEFGMGKDAILLQEAQEIGFIIS